MSVALVEHALCSVGDVLNQRQLTESISAQNTDFYARLINTFSSHVQRHCARMLVKKPRVEYADGGRAWAPVDRVFVTATPIDPDATFEIADDPSRSFPDNSKLTENVDFIVADRNLGIVQKVGPQWMNAGFRNLPSTWGRRDDFQALLSQNTFNPGTQNIRMTYTGGLITPRGPGPQPPALTPAGNGLSGVYGFCLTTILDGQESLPSDAAVAQLDDQGAALTFDDPGPGATVRIYRTAAGGTPFGFLTSIPGAVLNGTLAYTDSGVPDLSLGGAPPEAGPLETAEASDLRGACMAQVADWARKRTSPSAVTLRTDGDGSVTLGDDVFLPWVKEMIEHYVRGGF